PPSGPRFGGRCPATSSCAASTMPSPSTARRCRPRVRPEAVPHSPTQACASRSPIRRPRRARGTRGMTGRSAARSGPPRYVPEDSLKSPRFTGPSTFARLPYVGTIEEVALAVVGVPFDTGVTYRAGGRFGPNGVRAASVMLRPYNANLGVKPFDILSCVDYGDVAIVPAYIERSYEAIEQTVAPIVEAGVVPLLIGGDHACTLPHLRATRSKGPVAVIDFDSHTDAWDSYFGEKYNHGTWMR